MLKEVSDLEWFSKSMNIPDEVSIELCDANREEVVGKMSSFLLEKGLTWTSLKKGLTESNERVAMEQVCRLETIIFEGSTSRQQV